MDHFDLGRAYMSAYDAKQCRDFTYASRNRIWSTL